MSPQPPRDRPLSKDGRAYPAQLRYVEHLDARLLQLFSPGEEWTMEQISTRTFDREVTNLLAQWVSSATWRGLIVRTDGTIGGTRKYAITNEGMRVKQAHIS